MKHYLILSACVLAVCAAQAKEFKYDLPTMCDETALVIKSLTSAYGETLVWTGAQPNDASAYSMWLNSSTQTWTVLKMSDTHSCIVGAGTAYKVVPKT